MLWTDSIFVSTADLASIDSDVLNAASAQDVSITNSIQRGIEDAGRFLESSLISFATYISSNDLSANHLAAVFYTGSQPNQRRRVTLDQVVISGRNPTFWSDLKQWAVNKVLISAYVQIASRAQNDRYEEKLKRYQERDLKEHWPILKKSGVPVVYRPMPVPGAVQLPNAGTWLASAVAGGGGYSATGAFDVAISYVDQSLYISELNPQNRESDLSARQSVTLTTGHAIKVDPSNLRPPNGQVDPAALARGFTVYGSASGYNIWVGPTGQALTLQNASPIPITVQGSPSGVQTIINPTPHTLPTDPTTTGPQPFQGQYPEAYLTVPNLFTRA